ncbi:MFS transporter [Neotabrizicola shimadae]|uniref:MFS transporter n=1 Tax=Neotabrizicola shimadae TaxID=2807096 RepID=A0A8G0ZPW8_9RHOB|nr:MFS transporter [Neotabrizicola shimadae]QYZ68254.1 MFS transporter [Neotabrizicola shimadae]
MPDRPSAFAPFRYRTFLLLWLTSQVSNLGGLIQGVGASWQMTSLTSSSAMIALVQASTSLPIMLFSLLAGALADSQDRRRILLVAQGLMMAVSVTLTVFAFMGWLTPWGLLTFTFLLGVGTALNNPAWQASVGDIVPREALPEAVSLNAMGFNLMRSVGPALGGAIVAAFGAALAFAINALSYLPLLGMLLGWKPPARTESLPREPFGAAVGAGLRYVAMSPNLLRVMLRSGLFGLGAVAILALLPIVARDQLKGDAFVYGVLLGGFGLGAIGGGLLNPRLRELMSSEWLVRGGFLGFAAGLAALSQAPGLLLALPATLVSGACWVLALSLFNTTVQLSSPRWVVGRTLAMYQMSTFGGMAAGSWLWGSLASGMGIEGALLAAAAALVAGALVGLVLAMPDLASSDLDPLGRFQAPALELDLRGRSGPIMVMVEYRIRQEDVPEFLTVMAERRRIRRRDGARQWVLLRDLEHAEQWTESYHVATWDDYLRHNMRRTKADAEVSDRLQALHQGDWPPVVHRMIERQSVYSHQDVALKMSHDHHHP